MADTATAQGFEPPALGEPYLLTPGPLTTAYSVKRAMLKDWGSWDGDFRAMTADMRRRLLALTGDRKSEYDCVPLQGSGSYCDDAMLGSFGPKDGKVLGLANGAYGLRAAQTMKYLGRAHTLIDKGDYLPPRGDEVAAALDADPTITHVLAIHCETSSGILNPVPEIAEVVGQQVHRGRAGLRLRHREKERAGSRQGQQPFAVARRACAVGGDGKDRPVALHAADACRRRFPRGA